MAHIDDILRKFRIKYPNEKGYVLVQVKDGEVTLLGSYPDRSILYRHIVKDDQYFFWGGPESEEPSSYIG